MKEKLAGYANRINQYADKISYRYADDKSQHESIKLGFILTIVVWIFLLIGIAFMPVFDSSKKYKTIQITLAPVETPQPEKKAQPKVENKVQQKPAQKSSASASSKTVQKTEAPKTQTAPKAAPKAAAPKPAAQGTANQPKAAPAPKKANIKYKQSVEDMFDQAVNTDTKKADFDSVNWENAASNTSSEQSNGTVQKSIAKADALAGTAGTATTTGGKAVSKEDTGTQASGEASSETKSALNKISETKAFSNPGEGFKSEANVTVQNSGDGKVAMEMTDGSARVLLDPQKPYIFISDENGKKIDSSRTVKIYFTVLKDGTVPMNQISYRPGAVLPVEIQSEISGQISKWRFSQASSDGQAVFEYSIIKR